MASACVRNRFPSPSQLRSRGGGKPLLQQALWLGLYRLPTLPAHAQVLGPSLASLRLRRRIRWHFFNVVLASQSTGYEELGLPVWRARDVSYYPCIVIWYHIVIKQFLELLESSLCSPYLSRVASCSPSHRYYPLRNHPSQTPALRSLYTHFQIQQLGAPAERPARIFGLQLRSSHRKGERVKARQQTSSWVGW